MEYTQNWKMLFELAKLDEVFDKPLTPKLLSNPEHKAVMHIIYLYSMESFIYADLNKVCREKDKSKIKYYGAFAAALSFIIHSANKNRVDNKLQDTTVLFRGLKLFPSEVTQYKKGSTINLLGYTSTSKDFKTALHFSFKFLT